MVSRTKSLLLVLTFSVGAPGCRFLPRYITVDSCEDCEPETAGNGGDGRQGDALGGDPAPGDTASGDPTPGDAASPPKGPIIEAVTTLDTNGNGMVDLYVVAFDRAVVDASYDAAAAAPQELTGDLTLDTTALAAPPFDVTDDETVYFTVVEGGVVNTDKVGDLTAGRGALVALDASALPSEALSSDDVREQDGAGPVLMAVRYDGRGTKAPGDDVLTVDFSERLGDASVDTSVGGVGNDFIAADLDFGTLSQTVSGTADDSQVTILLGKDASLAALASATLDTQEEAITDRFGNVAPAAPQPLSIVDVTPPTVRTVVTLDRDGNGRIDHYQVTFSAPVLEDTYDPAAATAQELVLEGGSTPLSDLSAMDDQTIHIRLLEPSTGLNTGVTGTLGGSTGLIRGVNGAASVAFFVGLPTDGAAPLPWSASTADSDSNGHIDAVVVTFSEDLASIARPEDFSVLGYVVVAAAELSPGQVTLAVDELGSPDTDAQPFIEYMAGDGRLRDGGDNPLADFDALPSVDGAAPQLMALAVVDRDLDGRVETVETAFSEGLDDATLTPAGFTMEGRAFDVADTGVAANDEYMDLRIVPPSSPMQGTRAFDVTYAASVGSLADRAGSPLADIASGDVTEEDKAAPVLMPYVHYTDSDGTTDGEVSAGDRVQIIFSEDVEGNGLTASHFQPAVTADAFGDAPTVGGVTADRVALFLGAAPSLHLRFAFVGSRSEEPGAPSGLTLAGQPSDLIRDASGNGAVLFLGDRPADVAPGFRPGTASGSGDASAVALADLDQDGDLDYVVAHSDVNGASGSALRNQVYLGDGTGAFGNASGHMGGLITEAGPYAQSENELPTHALAIGDLNRDAFPDVVYGDTGQLTVILNPGSVVPALETESSAGKLIRVQQSIPLSAGAAARAVRLGDLDLDGVLDLVAAVDSGGGLLVYTWDRQLNEFALPGIRLGDASVQDTELLDVDRDGDLDIVGLTAADYNVVWMNQLGTPGSLDFQRGQVFPRATDSVAAEVGDFDGDGDVDLVEAVSGFVLFYRSLRANTGSVELRESQTVEVPHVVDVVLRDMDHDGDLDVLAVGGDGAGSAVLFNSGDGSFLWSGATIAIGAQAFGAAVGDIDRDGDGDVLLGCTGPNEIAINDASAGLDFPLAAATALYTNFFGGGPAWQTPSPAQRVAVGDLNRDGISDLVVAAGSRQDVVYLGTEQGTFSSPSDIGATLEARAVALGDLDRDGDIDIVFAGPGSAGDPPTSGVHLFETQTSTTPASLSFVDHGVVSGADGLDLQIHDMDNDGWLDIVVGTSTVETSLVLYNSEAAGASPPGFNFANTAPLGVAPNMTESLVVLDANLDGIPDVWLGRSRDPDNPFDPGGTEICSTPPVCEPVYFDQLVLGVDGISFSAPIYSVYGGLTPGVAAADANFDGRVDVAAAGVGWTSLPYYPRCSNPPRCDEFPSPGETFAILGYWTPAPTPLFGRAVAVADFLLDGAGKDGREEILWGWAAETAGQMVVPSSLRFHRGMLDCDDCALSCSPSSPAQCPRDTCELCTAEFGFGDLSVSDMAVADVDRDGDLDIVASGDAFPSCSVCSEGVQVFHNAGR